MYVEDLFALAEKQQKNGCLAGHVTGSAKQNADMQIKYKKKEK